MLLAGLSACGGERAAPPRWLALARGHEPAPLLPLVRAWQEAAGLDPDAAREFFMGVQVVHPLARADWAPGSEPEHWTTPLPGGAFAFGTLGFLRLESTTFGAKEALPGGPLAVGAFRVQGGRIELRLPAGREPPDELSLVLYLENGWATDGVWRVRIASDEFHDGIPVWSGRTAELACEVPAASQLAFELRFLTRSAPAPLTLRVRLDSALVFEVREDSGALAAANSRIRFELPPRARPRARLAFEVEGPPGQLLLLHPVLGPAEFGSYAARPWPDARPDIVLFLADTLRADALALGGGAPELAPNLNRFAEGALRFPNARSNAAWTLPSIGTLLTGLAPGQHTANDTHQSLPSEVVTLVERLSRAGYRTGAVTDAAFFTPTHGLDQGFESFRPNPSSRWDLDATIRQALDFVQQDDGRPVFLVVHTYRTHMPYRVGPDEDIGPWNALKQRFQPLALRSRLSREEWLQRFSEVEADYRALYQEGVKDLDRGFGELLAGLAQRGLLAHGVVVFTSDHGEALGENDDIFHGGPLWESKLRIPLLVTAPGLAPREVRYGVTLLDLAPTLAALARLERDPLWPGESLLGIARERPAWAFRLQKTRQFSLVEGAHKLLAAQPEDFDSGACELAFDLDRDPYGEEPLDAAWAPELARRHAAALRSLLVPSSASAVAPLSEHDLRELEGLGYTGDGEADEEGSGRKAAEPPREQ